jgi:cytochrome c556
MKKTILLPGLLALGFAVCVVAQTEADFSGWMKDVAKTKGSVAKAVKGGQNSEAAESATHLSDLFKQVGGYFSSHNMADAAGMAKNAQSAASDLASAAKAGDAAKMDSSLMAVNGSCGGCHMAHRVPGDSPGTFKIQ